MLVFEYMLMKTSGSPACSERTLEIREVIFAAIADAVEDVVVDVLQVDFDADFLSVRLGSFCEEREFCTAG